MIKVNHQKVIRLLMAFAVIGSFVTLFAQENLAQADGPTRGGKPIRGGGGSYNLR